MKKIIYILLAALLILSFSACSKSNSSAGEFYETTISFDKEGRISEVIVESFDKSYYTEDGLNAFFQEKISEYNSTNIGAGDVTLDKISVSDGIARATLVYDSAETYKAFNGTSIFYGTVSEAYDKGYITETVLKARGSDATITKNDLMKMSKDIIIVVSEPVRVESPRKIAYTSANVEVVDDRTARISSDSTGLAYIVIK